MRMAQAVSEIGNAIELRSRASRQAHARMR
jgi:hypothetical protein